ncbi:MAG TPA: UDP-N-acetylmuramoyl-L-alanyl-D-glutamate--2,6-diaminopimelate ligase [Tenericutes bacterium]|nr:UDP-N-acetylmuramoyl-L-alanyl-D-glutamate--2,6-diaminopimelate ligase [Mycoplasmatota bacterium]
MNIKVDSRKIVPGNTFVALRGNKDGHTYVLDAIKNGAARVIVEEGLYDVETLIVKDTRKYLEDYLYENYYNYIKDLKIIGVTGTNGKTTTCYLLHECLNNFGIKTAYIGTIGFYINDKIRELNNTTPDILDLYELLIECKEKECKYVVMEVSSHALSLGRVETIKFDYALFTNLTKDHLDFHKTMDEYKKTKIKLFKKLKDKGKAIINADSQYKNDFLLPGVNNITYGFMSSDYQIIDYNVSKNNSKFLVKNKSTIMAVTTNLIGKHNLYNILSTIAILSDIGIEKEKISKIFESISAPPGRMDKINYKDNTIIIDYAHTPDAVINVLIAVKKLNPNKIITVVGCGGDRDKTKRSEMAIAATNLSNHVVFTSDNPRTEDAKQIIDDMINNLNNNNYEIEINRKKAIIKGIQMLKKNDILMVLGKGHENYQIIGTTKYHFDDKEVVLENI